jgi:hypothetical protein
MIPVYFLYKDELNAQDNWYRCSQVAQWAVAFESIGTIFQSHKAIADHCQEDRFYVVDGDCWILDNFRFNQQVDLKPKSVAVFRAKNPVNGLVYGHGGIKLFSRDCFSLDRLDRPDMTTTLADAYIKVNVLASEHRFNYTPFSTWRTAFREAVKLSAGLNKNNNDQESHERLSMWCEAGIEARFGYFSLQGARAGVAYAAKDNADYSVVNDFDWIEKEFKEWLGLDNE